MKWTFNSIQYSIGVREITFTAWLSLGLKISPPYLHASMIKQRKVLLQARGSTKKKTKKIKVCMRGPDLILKFGPIIR